MPLRRHDGRVRLAARLVAGGRSHVDAVLARSVAWIITDRRTDGWTSRRSGPPAALPPGRPACGPRADTQETDPQTDRRARCVDRARWGGGLPSTQCCCLRRVGCGALRCVAVPCGVARHRDETHRNRCERSSLQRHFARNPGVADARVMSSIHSC